jgi:hypothetical protein
MQKTLAVRMNSRSQNNLQQRDLVNRVVLLGASNLTLSLRRVIGLVRRRCGGPSEVLVAVGHGRSYGQPSQVLARALPGIASCGLWAHLDASATLPTYALLTDIGNDIPYGYLPEDILRWVYSCVERLQQQDAQIIMTNLPLAPIESLSETRFRIFRSIFFPSAKLSRHETVERARKVHRGLQEMAASRHIDLCEPEPRWFGPDAIHLHYWKRAEAYRGVVERFTGALSSQCQSGAGAFEASIWKQRPRFARAWVLGKEQYCRQPSGELVDGSIVSKY